MDEVNSQKRPKRSTLRQRQAQATADLIVAAGRALFLENGYASTTIEAIAARAEVAVSTIYAVFGSKRGILRAIRASWHERSQIREVTYGDLGNLGAEKRLEMLAQGTRRQWETGSDVTTIYSGAAAADPEAAAELSMALEGRRVGMQHFAEGMQPYLRGGLDAARAAVIIEALCMAEVFHLLVRRSGWTGEEYENWLLQTLKQQLLDIQ